MCLQKIFLDLAYILIHFRHIFCNICDLFTVFLQKGVFCDVFVIKKAIIWTFYRSNHRFLIYLILFNPNRLLGLNHYWLSRKLLGIDSALLPNREWNQRQKHKKTALVQSGMLRIWRCDCALCVIGNEFPCRQPHNPTATLSRGHSTLHQG